MYYGQVWRRGRLESFYSQFIAPGDLAFDIGSHVGNRTRAWRHLGARVVAVEPQPDFFRILQLFFGRDASVILENCGVAERAGVGTLFISERTPTVSSCTGSWVDDARASERFSSVHWDQEMPVQMQTLQQLIDKHGVPTFCKIDIEGGEEAALNGLHTPLAALSFECVLPMRDRAARCIDTLARLGSYEFRYSQLETMRWVNTSWLKSDEMKEFLDGLPRNGPAGDVYARRLRT